MMQSEVVNKALLLNKGRSNSLPDQPNALFVTPQSMARDSFFKQSQQSVAKPAEPQAKSPVIRTSSLPKILYTPQELISIACVESSILFANIGRAYTWLIAKIYNSDQEGWGKNFEHWWRTTDRYPDLKYRHNTRLNQLYYYMDLPIRWLDDVFVDYCFARLNSFYRSILPTSKQDRKTKGLCLVGSALFSVPYALATVVILLSFAAMELVFLIPKLIVNTIEKLVKNLFVRPIKAMWDFHHGKIEPKMFRDEMLRLGKVLLTVATVTALVAALVLFASPALAAVAAATKLGVLVPALTLIGQGACAIWASITATLGTILVATGCAFGGLVIFLGIPKLAQFYSSHAAKAADIPSAAQPPSPQNFGMPPGFVPVDDKFLAEDLAAAQAAWSCSPFSPSPASPPCTAAIMQKVLGIGVATLPHSSLISSDGGVSTSTADPQFKFG
jgi:hypothetical protein